jgi:hypothetical protein
MTSFSLTHNHATFETSDLSLYVAVAKYLSGEKPNLSATLTTLPHLSSIVAFHKALTQLKVDTSDFIVEVRRKLALENINPEQVGFLSEFLAEVDPQETDPISLASLEKLAVSKPYEPINTSRLFGMKKVSAGLAQVVVPELFLQLTTENSVIAGGMAMMYGTRVYQPIGHESDVDVWIYGRNQQERRQAFDRLEALLLERNAVAGLRGSSVVTFSIPTFGYNIQLILTGATSPAEVIRSFDIDASRAYLEKVNYGLRLECYALPEAILAWERRCITKAPVINAFRLEKMKRRGFEIKVAYKPPSDKEMDEYLHRGYIHSPVAPWSQIQHCMRTLLGCTAVWSRQRPVDRQFDYKELYGQQGLNLGYDTNIKIEPHSADFCFEADVEAFATESKNNTTYRLRLTNYQLPPELLKLDNGHLQYDGFKPQDLLRLKDHMFVALRRGLAEPATGRYLVCLEYKGVAFASQGANPIYRISELLPL